MATMVQKNAITWESTERVRGVPKFVIQRSGLLYVLRQNGVKQPIGSYFKLHEAMSQAAAA